MHPDKSSDPNAHEKFSEITKIYEVLKDDDLRKKYDKWGEKGLEDDFNPNRGRYEDWRFYQEDFGLYDNDDQIEVLDRSSLFDAMASDELWFIKFYSERCSHCNDLAPKWRELASQMSGVAHFGAISCRDFRQTCMQLGINGYPSLLLFRRGASRFNLNGENVRRSESKYKMARDVDQMRDYVLTFAKTNIHELKNDRGPQWLSKPVIYILSDSDGDSPINKFPDQYIISNRLTSVFQIMSVNCAVYDPFKLCQLRSSDEGGIIYQPAESDPIEQSQKLVRIDTFNTQGRKRDFELSFNVIIRYN